jgi:thiosulfate/3-mercaptopyruvate sulfurtransferase
VERIADPASDLPHMLPSERQFAAAADALGISNDDSLVVYDGSGIFSAARAWWTWRVFGHHRCGGFEGLEQQQQLSRAGLTGLGLQQHCCCNPN